MRWFVLTLAIGCTKPDPSTDSSPTTPGPDPEPPWPEWAFHHWVWENESTQDSALALVDGYLDRDIPVGAIIIDSPWATGYSTYEWDTALFPDPQAMVDELHDKGVRVFVWTVPVINVDTQPLYDDTAAAGYFMAPQEGGDPAVIDWWKGQGSLIDYWNPDAMDAWHGMIDITLDLGIDGWKCDGADYFAAFASWSPGAGRDVSRLEYSHAYYQDMHDYTRDRLGDDRINTARPVDNYGLDVGGDGVAFAPIDINWAGWVGDQDATFDGLRAALLNMYYSAEYGYVAFGSDIGGFRTEDAYPQGRSKEVLLRWAQQGAFAPVMENGGGGLHEPWAFDEETVDIYADFVDLHYALLPYLRRQGAMAFDEGRSLMTFQSKEEFEYLLGPDVYFAPILQEGATTRLVAPPDPDSDWVYLFDDTVVVKGGETATLDVQLDQAAVLVRDGSRVQGELAAR